MRTWNRKPLSASSRLGPRLRYLSSFRPNFPHQLTFQYITISETVTTEILLDLAPTAPKLQLFHHHLQADVVVRHHHQAEVHDLRLQGLEIYQDLKRNLHPQSLWEPLIGKKFHHKK